MDCISTKTKLHNKKKTNCMLLHYAKNSIRLKKHISHHLAGLPHD